MELQFTDDRAAVVNQVCFVDKSPSALMPFTIWRLIRGMITIAALRRRGSRPNTHLRLNIP